MFTLFACSSAADLALRAAHGRLIRQESVPSENYGELFKIAHGLLRQSGRSMSLGMRERMQRDDEERG